MVKSAVVALGLTAGLLALPMAHVTAPAAHAQTADGTATPITTAPSPASLAALMRMDETFAILAEEGRGQAADLENGFFPGRGGAAWAATVAGIYDTAPMQDRFVAAFEAALGGDAATLAAAEAFFAAPLGQRILTLELEARRAMIDEDVNEAAEVMAEKMQADRDPRLRLIRRMIETSDLVEMNVAGALTANLAFTLGLAETAPMGQGMPAEDLMADVWGQEGAVRASTTTWLYAYMVMAYGPLTDDELQAYIDFWETTQGKALNTALFSAFDAVFVPISAEMGRATGKMAQSNEI